MAADPGTLVLKNGILLDYTLDARAPVRAEPLSLTLLPIPNPAASNDPTQPAYIYRRPVPQYYIDESCFRLKPQSESLELNFIDPPNYRSLDDLSLEFDSDTIFIRPYPGVSINYNYNSYILIASEDRSATQYTGGGSFGICLPTLPVYPPEEPDQNVVTAP
jgi:hypothetical protein